MGILDQWKSSKQDRAQCKAWEALDEVDVSLLRDALRLGASVNQANGAGFTLAHQVIVDQKVALLPVLDQAGALWDLCVPDGRSGLHLAVQTSQSLWVKAMLDRGVDLEIKTQMGASALHMAARLGAGQVIRLLDNAGASWAARDKQGNAPLDILARVHPALHATWTRVINDRQST